MTLLERLKPEFLQKLKIVKEQYPTTAEKIEISLSENESVFALTIQDASRICIFLDNKETTLNNILNMIEDDE